MDIWALGCVLYHLATLEPPFYGENLITLGYNIVHKFPKPIGNMYSHKLSAFIFKLLEKSPTNRPRIHDILFSRSSHKMNSYCQVVLVFLPGFGIEDLDEKNSSKPFSYDYSTKLYK